LQTSSALLSGDEFEVETDDESETDDAIDTSDELSILTPRSQSGRNVDDLVAVPISADAFGASDEEQPEEEDFSLLQESLLDNSLA
jgi:hypothetical protein